MSSFRENLEALGSTEASHADLTRELSELPQRISAAEAQAQQARDTVVSERERLAAAEKARRDREGQLSDAEARRDKFQGQTALVKTNTEYTTLLHEIEEMSGKISEIEDQILAAMESADEVRDRLGGVESEQKQLEQAALQKAEQLRERMVVVGHEIEAQTRIRDGLLAELGPEVQKIFARISKGRGTALAQIYAANCGACHRSIPPELENRVLAGELHCCPNCQRMLVIKSA